jgi:hypothetical protein
MLTVNGKLEYSRYVLRPQTKEDEQRLKEIEGVTLIVPMDEYLEIAKLPFKMTADLMVEVAFWGQNQRSYQAAEEALLKVLGVSVNDDTIRMVTNAIGSIVYENDCRAAEDAYARLNAGKLQFPRRKKEGILYIETDGAALNTRHKGDDGSTWRENKLGVVFSSDNIRFWKDKKGNRQHSINKREYISYIGSASEFQKHLLACAIRNGYGKYRQTVILSDGATWIRNMKDELFPDAQQILDFYHLCENVSDYAKHAFKMDESKYKPWADRICKVLKESRHEEVLAELESFGEKASGNCPVNLKTYIKNNAANIDYASYEKMGYFIGSGAIESGNKVVLQHRLKNAGMRWNVAQAQYLLSLRAKKESDLWQRDVVRPVKSRYT